MQAERCYFPRRLFGIFCYWMDSPRDAALYLTMLGAYMRNQFLLFSRRRRTKNRTIIHKTTFNSVIRIFRNIKKRISLNLSLYFRYRKIHPSPFDFSILIFLPRLLSIVPFSIFPYPLPFGYLFFSKKRKKRIVLSTLF